MVAFAAPGRHEASLPYVVDPAVTLRSVLGANNGAGAASITESVPAGVAANDFMLAVVSIHGGSGRTISAPGGWTLLRRENQGIKLAQAIYYRTATGSEPASYQWTFNASDKATGGIIAYSGSISPTRSTRRAAASAAPTGPR